MLVLRQFLQTPRCRLRLLLGDAHLLGTRFGEGRLASLFFSDTVRVVRVGELAPARQLIVAVKRVPTALRLRSLEQRTALSAEHSIGFEAVRDHLLRATLNISENSQTLG